VSYFTILRNWQTKAVFLFLPTKKRKSLSLSFLYHQPSYVSLFNKYFLLIIQKHCFYIAIAMLLGCNSIEIRVQKQ